MKIKYCLFIILLFIISIVKVDASSIEYNITINKQLDLQENIIYKVHKNELDLSENYDFLTSVVNDTVYFDIKKEVPYKKTKTIQNDEYTVVLSHNFYPMFLSEERILKECFGKLDFEDNNTKLAINLKSPFYCLHRADSIKINIKTDLEVIKSNADLKSNNIHTWEVKDKQFNLQFTAQIPKIENEPMDYDYEEVEEQEDSKEPTQQDEKDDEKSNISTAIIITIIAVSVVTGLVVVIILKQKKNNLNKI